MQSSQRRQAVEATNPISSLYFAGSRAFEISIVVKVVEALDQEVIGSVHVLIQPCLGAVKRRVIALFSATCSSEKTYVSSLFSGREISVTKLAHADDSLHTVFVP